VAIALTGAALLALAMLIDGDEERAPDSKGFAPNAGATPR
jgi:hypothetical protein